MEDNTLLANFFAQPEREFHIRELAGKLKKSPTTISKMLRDFEQKKLLISQKKLNHLLYRANTQSGAFTQKKLFYNLGKLRASGLIDFLENEYSHPQAIVLFGSFAKAENIPQSDIDILVISPVQKELNLSRFEKKLGAPIQLFVHGKQEIKKMKNKHLINNWINGVVLSGYWEFL